MVNTTTNGEVLHSSRSARVNYFEPCAWRITSSCLSYRTLNNTKKLAPLNVIGNPTLVPRYVPFGVHSGAPNSP